MPFSTTSPYDPSSMLRSQYGVKCWDLHIYMHVHTFVHTYIYASRWRRAAGAQSPGA